MQYGASFRNADVARASREAAAADKGPWFVVDPESRLRHAWTAVTSVFLLYTVFWVRMLCQSVLNTSLIR